MSSGRLALSAGRLRPPAMDAPTSRELPEAALAAAERVIGLSLCVHDHLGLLIPFLPARRLHHLHAPCAQVKTQRQRACDDCCHHAVLAAAERFRHGLLKRCHAGVVEWVLPVFCGDSHWLTIYAGPRTAGAGLRFDQDAPQDPTGFWAPLVAAVAPLGRAEAEAVMEVLRQLAARLERWRERDLPRLAAPPAEHWKRNRRAEIAAWIVARHREQVGLEDLAAHLHLGSERARHVLHELCGTGLAELLVRERLNTAGELLERTDMPVAAVARASGFHSRSHFHDAFQQAHGCAPGAWRKRRRGG